MARCRVCGSRSPLTASSLGACAPCIRADPPALRAHISTLFVFSTHSYLHDLPVTSEEHAEEALAAAKAAGLTRVRVGSMLLLGEPYDHRSRMAV
jgi:hypothetical protein